MKRNRNARISEENRKYLMEIKRKNKLRSIDEAIEYMRNSINRELGFKNRKIKIFREIDL